VLIFPPELLTGGVMVRNHFLHPGPARLYPAAVVRPRTTEDMVEIITVADQYEIPVVPRVGEAAASELRECAVVLLSIPQYGQHRKF